ncbi:MAG TPA: hypothetical protein DCW29_08885 [Janthinobacterium sp.]|nr:hypothetical protein [Janthinobacterium sp.]
MRRGPRAAPPLSDEPCEEMKCSDA